MFWVKMTILLWAITFVWMIFAHAASKNVRNAFKIAKKEYPWWYLMLGWLTIFDLIGFLYIVVWLLFL